MSIEQSITNTILDKDQGDWYLLQCKPREEVRAKENLLNQGYRVFLPEVNVSKKTRSGFIETPAPLFPGYLFINLNQQVDNWAPVRSTRGVNKIVSFGQIPAKVPYAVMGLILSQVQNKNNQENYPFKKGETVIINSGPFKALQAVFDCRDGQQRVWVFLELMRKSQRIAITDTELNKVA